MNDSSWKRVVVVGTSGAGKTTFARSIAAITDAPHIELDYLHWGPNWTVRDDFHEAVATAVQREAWVIDGNYSAVRNLVWRRSTAIVWLDFSFHVVFRRALKRTARRVLTREPLFAGNRETIARALFDLEGVPWWIVRTYRKRRRETPKLAAQPEYAHARFVELRSPREADAFLDRLRQG
jgi:adenylate kinase family enzyme